MQIYLGCVCHGRHSTRSLQAMVGTRVSLKRVRICFDKIILTMTSFRNRDTTERLLSSSIIHCLLHTSYIHPLTPKRCGLSVRRLLRIYIYTVVVNSRPCHPEQLTAGRYLAIHHVHVTSSVRYTVRQGSNRFRSGYSYGVQQGDRSIDTRRRNTPFPFVDLLVEPCLRVCEEG